jgi:hypothetical protein
MSAVRLPMQDQRGRGQIKATAIIELYPELELGTLEVFTS